MIECIGCAGTGYLVGGEDCRSCITGGVAACWICRERDADLVAHGEPTCHGCNVRCEVEEAAESGDRRRSCPGDLTATQELPVLSMRALVEGRAL